MSFTLINRSSDLDFLDEELLNKPYIGVDTEFRRRGKHDIDLALIQVNDGQEIFLIDCVSIEPHSESCSFLTDKGVIKIFHSCREDIDALVSWTKQAPVNMFDTQLANAFLGGSFSISYKKLVEGKLGVSLDKDETRSNWVKRPLRDSQLRYAASDVEFLLDLYEIQIEELKKLKRLEWVNQEIEFLKRKSNVIETNKKSHKIIKLTKSEEREFLITLDLAVNKISESIHINKTLLLSKKEQRELLKKILYEGVELALIDLCEWRKDLLFIELSKLMKRVNLHF